MQWDAKEKKEKKGRTLHKVKSNKISNKTRVHAGEETEVKAVQHICQRCEKEEQKLETFSGTKW